MGLQGVAGPGSGFWIWAAVTVCWARLSWPGGSVVFTTLYCSTLHCCSVQVRQITGLDISEGMLAVAGKKAVYTTATQADLLQPLPVQPGEFDILACVGVTTYLQPAVLSFWLKAVRSAGLIVFTHKAGIPPLWELEQVTYVQSFYSFHNCTAKNFQLLDLRYNVS